jgi:hypothetical protein
MHMLHVIRRLSVESCWQLSLMHLILQEFMLLLLFQRIIEVISLGHKEARLR